MTSLHTLATEVASVVFHPDYYKGHWAIYCGEYRRVCPNHSTARAWQLYLGRKGFWYAEIGKVEPPVK